MPTVRLLPIDHDTEAALAAGADAFGERYGVGVGPHAGFALAVVQQTLALLRDRPRAPAWGGFLAAEPAAAVVVGMCGFKDGPNDRGEVEIAYGTVPGAEGRGYATAAAAALVRRALAGGVRTVVAHTLPEPNASGRILTKLGFARVGEVTDPEDGLVWRWEFRAPALTIRPAAPADHDAIWELAREAIAAGDVFAWDGTATRDEVLRWWVGPGVAAFVAETDGRVVGSAYLKPNQAGRGSHVANAGFVVGAAGRGRGVGRAMGEHVLREAAAAGYRAMQFNYVVSTNAPAVALWQSLGFRVVATLPGAFRHPVLGYVDVFVMFREL